jgi:hypothetical protein
MRTSSRAPAWSTIASTSAGIVDSPASRAARQRRSPATSSYPSSAGLTITGWSTPRSLIESASASRAAPSKRLRGCSGLARICSNGMLRNRESRVAPTLDSDRAGCSAPAARGSSARRPRRRRAVIVPPARPRARRAGSRRSRRCCRGRTWRSGSRRLPLQRRVRIAGGSAPPARDQLVLDGLRRFGC